MKYLVMILSFVLSTSLKAQISIGKDEIGESVIMDFNDTANTRGLILPAVTNLPASPAHGTFVFDTNDRKIKVYENGGWKALSENGNINQINTVFLNTAVENGEGVILGDDNGADGVLVLESPDKALVLPKVASPHINVKNPYPGMICYDTDSKSLAVFDGNKWYYWE